MFHIYTTCGHGFYSKTNPLERPAPAPMATLQVTVADNPQRGAKEAREMLADGRTQRAYLPRHQITAVLSA